MAPSTKIKKPFFNGAALRLLGPPIRKKRMSDEDYLILVRLTVLIKPLFLATAAKTKVRSTPSLGIKSPASPNFNVERRRLGRLRR